MRTHERLAAANVKLRLTLNRTQGITCGGLVHKSFQCIGSKESHQSVTVAVRAFYEITRLERKLSI